MMKPERTKYGGKGLDSMSYIISCCSTADLSKEHFVSRDLHYLCFHYELDGKEMLDDLGESMPFFNIWANFPH